MSEKTLEQLDEEIEQIKAKLSAQIKDLVDIITNDLPDYALKNIRKAFIEDIDFAESKSDAELAEFKTRVADFGKKLASDVRTSLLDNMEDWWGAGISSENGGKKLDGNAAISKKLGVISERIGDFLKSEQLKPIEIHYTTPARFIDGKYPPAFIEKYWAQLANLRSVEEQRAELDLEARKARLAQRWDSI
jgi:hypothetical protein